MHALKTAVPAGNDTVRADGEGDGFGSGMIVGGVEFGAIGEPACVFDGVPLDLRVGLGGAEDARFSEGTGADEGVDVAERVESFGDANDLGDVGRGGGAGGCGSVCGGCWFCRSGWFLGGGLGCSSRGKSGE